MFGYPIVKHKYRTERYYVCSFFATNVLRIQVGEAIIAIVIVSAVILNKVVAMSKWGRVRRHTVVGCTRSAGFFGLPVTIYVRTAPEIGKPQLGCLLNIYTFIS